MLSFVLGLLSEPVVYNLVQSALLAGVTGMIGRFTFLKNQEVIRNRAKDAMSAAATDLYPVVKALKDANGGKLTEEDRVTVNLKALERAQEIGKQLGLDVMKVLGPTIANSVLEQTVSTLKIGKSQPQLPVDVAAGLPIEPPIGFRTSPKAIPGDQS